MPRSVYLGNTVPGRKRQFFSSTLNRNLGFSSTLWRGVTGGKQQIFGYRFLPWLIRCVVEKVRTCWYLETIWFPLVSGRFEIQGYSCHFCHPSIRGVTDILLSPLMPDIILQTHNLPKSTTCWHWVGEVLQYSLLLSVKNGFPFHW